MLRLRPYKKADAKHIAGWIRDEATFRRWCADSFDKYPVRAEDIDARYERENESDSFIAMTAFDEDGPAGHLVMSFTNRDRTELHFGFIIVDDAKRGRGYGAEMLGLAAEYAFRILRVRRIWLGVFENNEPARRCYRSAGFTDVPADKERSLRFFGEDWKCLEMEQRR